MVPFLTSESEKKLPPAADDRILKGTPDVRQSTFRSACKYLSGPDLGCFRLTFGNSLETGMIHDQRCLLTEAGTLVMRRGIFSLSAAWGCRRGKRSMGMRVAASRKAPVLVTLNSFI